WRRRKRPRNCVALPLIRMYRRCWSVFRARRSSVFARPCRRTSRTRRPRPRRRAAMRDLMGLMEKAQEMQARMAEMQSELESTLVEGEAGGGAVRVQLTAKGDLTNIEIAEDLLVPEEKEMLQDLILTAHADARRKAADIAAAKMQDATAGLPIPPGMTLPF